MQKHCKRKQQGKLDNDYHLTDIFLGKVRERGSAFSLEFSSPNMSSPPFYWRTPFRNGRFPLLMKGSFCFLSAPPNPNSIPLTMSLPSHPLLPLIQIHKTSSFTGSVSTERPPPEPPPHVKQIFYFGPPDLPSPSILRFVSAPCPPSLPSLVRPPRKPPNKFRIDLKAVLLQGLCFYCPLSKPPWEFLGLLISVVSLCLLLLFLYVIYVVLCIVVCILFLCLIGFKLLCDWSLDSRCHTGSVGLYEDGSSFTALCLHQLIFVQRDKVKKSETMCSRNVRDEAKEMIRNWIGKKTLGSHLSFVSFRRWKMLNELIGYEIWIKFSCLSPMLMCTANPVVLVFFPCIGTSKLLGNTPSMMTLAACNPLYFMKC